MSEDAFRVWQACLASAASVGAAWMKFASSGVQYEQETSGVRDGLVDDSVLRSIHRNRLDRGADTMKPERYGISRQPDNPNVLEVDFQHFRTVRDVRRKLYGDWRSPLAGREVKP